jgi:hypothetical protein
VPSLAARQRFKVFCLAQPLQEMWFEPLSIDVESGKVVADNSTVEGLRHQSKGPVPRFNAGQNEPLSAYYTPLLGGYPRSAHIVAQHDAFTPKTNRHLMVSLVGLDLGCLLGLSQ